MKKTLLAFTLALSLLAPRAFAAPQEGIAATVNDSVITMTDVKNRVGLYFPGALQKAPPEALKKMQAQVLDKLIDEALELQEAKKLGINVAQADLDTGFANVAKQNNISAAEFKKRIKASGADASTLYDQIRADIAWSQVVRRTVRPQVDISEGDIDATLAQIKGGSGKMQYRVAEIFFKIPDGAQDSDARNAAEAIVDQLHKGASFSSLARQYSQAPGAATGGDLGWVQEDQVGDDDVAKALAKMHPGQVQVVRAQKGYHILFLRDERQNAGADAQNKIVSLKQIVVPLKASDSPDVINAKLARLHTLKKEVKSCAAMAAKMKQFKSPGTADLGERAMGDLAADLRNVVAPLPVGQLSDPFRNGAGAAVVMVCSRKDAPADGEAKAATPAAEDAGRDEIASKLGMQRLDQMATRYLRDLRAAAFIDKRL